ncbi:MAG: arsenate reductase ArsC [Deltaproteobacteria bacterium]|nr:arsenate reductase ArsC [Deltaproteobacteria bacterium]
MRACGLREVGRYERQAELEGVWRDVVIFERRIPENERARARVLFACVHNAGRSQMAAALFNASANPLKAIATSAGTQPAEAVHPEVATVLREIGLDVSSAVPQKLTPELAQGTHTLVTMGCGEECPVVPGARRLDWPLPDPKGRPLGEVRALRDDLQARVDALVRESGWARPRFA